MTPAAVAGAVLVALTQVARVPLSVHRARSRAGVEPVPYRPPLLLAHGGHESFILAVGFVAAVGWATSALVHAFS